MAFVTDARNFEVLLDFRTVCERMIQGSDPGITFFNESFCEHG